MRIEAQLLHSLEQWFLTFFTYLTLLSNKITRFTPNILIGFHLSKFEINELLQFMIYKNVHLLQFMVQQIYPQVKNHWPSR